MLKIKNRLANHRILLFGAPFLLLMLLAVVAQDDMIVLGENKSTEAWSYSAAAPAEPVHELMSFFDTITDDFELTIQHSGTIGTYEREAELKQLAAQMINALHDDSILRDGPKPELRTEQAGRYDYLYSNGGINIHLSIIGLAEQQQAWLSIKLQTNQAANADELTTITNKLNEKLSSLDQRPFWTYTAQGALASEASPEQNVFELITKRWNAKQTGSYSDAGSTSVSFDASVFAALTSTEDQNAGSFQAAVHRHSESGTSRLTIGIPAISIEY